LVLINLILRGDKIFFVGQQFFDSGGQSSYPVCPTGFEDRSRLSRLSPSLKDPAAFGGVF